MRLRREVRERVGLPITVGVARTKFLAKVASGVAKPDGLLVVPPDGELAFLHPLPVERLWGVGPVTAEKLHERGITTVGEVAAARRVARSSRCSAGRPGRTAPRARPQPRSAAGARRAPPRLDRVAARARPVAEVARRHRRRRSSPSSTASRAGCGPPAGSAARSCSGCASTTSRARRGRTRCPTRPPHTQTILATARALLATAMPMIERQGLTLVGVAVAQPRRRRRRPARRCRSTATAAAPSTPRSTRSATASGRTPITRAVLLGRDQGLTVPMLPD